jgi:hypothetical protein
LYRSQAWVSQPDQSIELLGLLSQPPSSSYTFSQGRFDYLNPVLDLSFTGAAEPSPASMIRNQNLRWMVFPAESPWFTEPGTFRPYDTDKILDRGALVVDWHNQYGLREARLWIDARTGILLRSQVFGGDNYSLLLSESVVTEIVFDENFPPARLSAEMRRVGESSPVLQATAPQPILPTPTLAAGPVNRGSPSFETPPPGFDPAASQLVFQFPNNLDASNILSGTAEVPIQLLADGYRLPDTRFGLPWMLRCDRSQDGYRLAFNTGSDGTAIPDDSLRWMDLRDPLKIYQPIPELHAESFAFSADGRRMAVFARSPQSDETGIYLIDLAIGESKLIFPLTEAQSLVWSPDGEYLGMMGVLEAGGDTQALLIHVRSGQIAFQSGSSSAESAAPELWPMSNWGVPFPQAMGGLEECAAPPAQ